MTLNYCNKNMSKWCHLAPDRVLARDTCLKSRKVNTPTTRLYQSFMAYYFFCWHRPPSQETLQNVYTVILLQLKDTWLLISSRPRKDVWTQHN